MNDDEWVVSNLLWALINNRLLEKDQLETVVTSIVEAFKKGTPPGRNTHNLIDQQDNNNSDTEGNALWCLPTTLSEHVSPSEFRQTMEHAARKQEQEQWEHTKTYVHSNNSKETNKVCTLWCPTHKSPITEVLRVVRFFENTQRYKGFVEEFA